MTPTMGGFNFRYVLPESHVKLKTPMYSVLVKIP